MNTASQKIGEYFNGTKLKLNLDIDSIDELKLLYSNEISKQEWLLIENGG